MCDQSRWQAKYHNCIFKKNAYHIGYIACLHFILKMQKKVLNVKKLTLSNKYFANGFDSKCCTN